MRIYVHMCYMQKSLIYLSGSTSLLHVRGLADLFRLPIGLAVP